MSALSPSSCVLARGRGLLNPPRQAAASLCHSALCSGRVSVTQVSDSAAYSGTSLLSGSQTILKYLYVEHQVISFLEIPIEAVTTVNVIGLCSQCLGS